MCALVESTMIVQGGELATEPTPPTLFMLRGESLAQFGREVARGRGPVRRVVRLSSARNRRSTGAPPPGHSKVRFALLREVPSALTPA
ncbi:hypothetical protein B0G69_7664 [Paraburkholderia sp. RAU2J]|nr:hypothetical protein B0G69_7664 [Paraburkholderia sp. RAU2J]